MKYKKISELERKMVFEAFKEERDWRATAKSLGVNPRTAYHWLRKSQGTSKSRGGSLSRKTPAVVKIIEERIEAEPSVTLRQIKEELMHKLNVDVCLNTVKNWLDGELFSVKAVRPTAQNMNRPENKLKRSQYIDQLFTARSEGRTLIWIDETNFNLFCKRKEGRSKIGSRAAVILPSSKGANLHCIGAMTSSQMVKFTTRRGAFKADDFKEWMLQLIDDCNEKGIILPTFIIDNAPAHSRAEQVLDIEQVAIEHNVEILRLGPYSYLLNPIELLWSCFKNYVKESLRERMMMLSGASSNGLTLTEMRMQAMEEIAQTSITRAATTSNLQNFANRVERYYSVASRQEDLCELP